MARKTNTEIGQKYNKLTVLSESPNGKRVNGCKMYLCRCDCGIEKELKGTEVYRGAVKSCGCLLGNKSLHPKHGHSIRGKKSKTYRTWENMVTRCTNSNNAAWPWYGGSGITVCDQWKNSFEQFLKDVGACPSPELSIDRIDNDLGYFPGNVRWATMKQQARNRRPWGSVQRHGVFTA